MTEKTDNLAVKERPMLFNGTMVRALFDGSKTQTRRIMKPQPVFESGYDAPHEDEIGIFWKADSSLACIDDLLKLCPHGQPGGRIWVRETFADIGCRLTYRADEDDGAHCKVERWIPSIHMPRADSRILLEIVSVRVERLNDCRDADARAEGTPGGHGVIPSYNYNATPSEHYSHLWESINGAGSWAANPWVWVIEFKRVTP